MIMKLRNAPYLKQLFIWLIALVWLVNGLYAKLLGFVPRHQEIVARILGNEYAWTLTKLIGIAELVMFIWVFSRFKSRWSAIAQMTVVTIMNLIEFALARDLLLFGPLNLLFASLFIFFVGFTEFFLPSQPLSKSV